MLGTAKPIASLSSGLLARKGQARPAMRPQGFHGTSLSLDDLGWNDMGSEEPQIEQVVTPAPAPLAPAVVAPVAAAVPPVLVEREALATEIGAVVVEEPAAPVAKPARPVSSAMVARIGREVGASKAKAAFTLRLDADRHLKLRLASASRNRSAQQLVTEALDAFIASLPEVEGLAAQLTRPVKASAGGK